MGKMKEDKRKEDKSIIKKWFELQISRVLFLKLFARLKVMIILLRSTLPSTCSDSTQGLGGRTLSFYLVLLQMGFT